jgi:hypothetical protein
MSKVEREWMEPPKDSLSRRRHDWHRRFGFLSLFSAVAQRRACLEYRDMFLRFSVSSFFFFPVLSSVFFIIFLKYLYRRSLLAIILSMHWTRCTSVRFGDAGGVNGVVVVFGTVAVGCVVGKTVLLVGASCVNDRLCRGTSGIVLLSFALFCMFVCFFFFFFLFLDEDEEEDSDEFKSSDDESLSEWRFLFFFFDDFFLRRRFDAELLSDPDSDEESESSESDDSDVLSSLFDLCDFPFFF